MLLGNDDTPWVIIPAVHDIFHPLLDDRGILSSLALTHTKADVLPSVVDQRNGADEELKVTEVSKISHSN